MRLLDGTVKLDFAGTVCDEWEDRGGKYVGMRQPDTQMKHGIVRHVEPSGKIWEQTFIEDEP